MVPEQDAEMRRFNRRLADFNATDGPRRLELAAALLARGEEARGDAAFDLLRAQFPSIADDLARSLAFHAYRELPDAAVDLLAWIELNLQAGVHDRHAGIDFDLRYHLYNWLQAEALVPYGRQDVFDDLAEIRDCLARDDKESAVAVLESLIKRFDASTSPPDVEP